MFACILLSFVNDLYVCAKFFSSTPHGGRVWRLVLCLHHRGEIGRVKVVLWGKMCQLRCMFFLSHTGSVCLCTG